MKMKVFRLIFPGLVALTCVFLVAGCASVQTTFKSITSPYKRGEADKAAFVTNDTAAAAKGYAEAARDGDSLSQFRLAHLYLLGRGVEKSDPEALRWMTASAEGGYEGAQQVLATWYFRGTHGLQQDPATGLAWMHKAAAQGSPDAMYALGVCYANGKGTERDVEQALRWFHEAKNKGMPVPDEMLDPVTYTQAVRAPAPKPPPPPSFSVISRPVEEKQPVTAKSKPTTTIQANDPPAPPLSREDLVAAVQDGLNMLGYNAGLVDGKAGKMTNQAVMQFQKAARIRADGLITPLLLEKIRKELAAKGGK
jgi:hypothetical protein